MCTKNYPRYSLDVDPRSIEEIKKYFKGLREFKSFVRIGPKGYLFPHTPDLQNNMNSIFEMPIRSSDIFVATFPRSGTTLTQELVWLVANDLDYATAGSKHLVERYISIGSYLVDTRIHSAQMEQYKNRNCIHLNKLMKLITVPTELLAATLDRRFIKSHIPLSMMPPNVLEIAKVIYVARDPRDVAVSLYYFSKLVTIFDFVGDFKKFWEFFRKGLVFRSPYFEQVKEAWAVRDHPNMLFLFYEELSQDISAVIRKVSVFLGKQYTDEQIAKLAEHLKIDNFKKNPNVNLGFLNEFNALVTDAEPFVRKGKVGGWRNYFDEKMAEQAETWIQENLRDTDLKYPQFTLN